MYQTVDNRKTLAQQNAQIAKHLDESLAARNKLYEANREHTRELYKMKQQIKSLEEEKTKLQEQLRIAQACEYLNILLFCILPIVTYISLYQVLQVTKLD